MATVGPFAEYKIQHGLEIGIPSLQVILSLQIIPHRSQSHRWYLIQLHRSIVTPQYRRFLVKQRILPLGQ